MFIKQKNQKHSSDKSPLYIAAVYVVVSILWIVFSDKAVEIIAGGSQDVIGRLQTLKGGFFVAVTGVMIYILVNSRLKQIKAGESRYKNLLEAAVDSVFTLGRSGVIDCNKQTLIQFNITNRNELIGKQPWEFSPPYQPDGRDSEEFAKEKIELALSGDAQVFEWQHMNFNGGIIDTTVSLSCADKENEIFFVIIRDMTEINQMQKMLQQSGKMNSIGQLAGGVAHDFNNIISGVLGYAELASIEVEDQQPVSKYIENIISAGNRASQLVSQILTFSRQSDEEKSFIKLFPVVNEAVELLKATLPASTDLKVDIDEQNGTVFVDAVKVHEILMNLSTNAVSAMDEKGVLHINLFEETVVNEIPGIIGPLTSGKYTVVEIIDSGSGIDEYLIPKIFEPFFTTKDTGKGTGLGLSVVYGIMQSHNGNIQVRSKRGSGSSFRLYFPKSGNDESAAKEEPEIIKGGRERILFVDDEAMLAELGKSLLSTLGYKVNTVSDSIEAFKILESNIQDYDLLITDQTMPDLTGLELIEKIHELHPSFPVILCTGYSTKVDDHIVGNSGCSVVFKPLTRKKLDSRIRELFD